MSTLLLHPIYHEFDNDTRSGGMEVYTFAPDHLPWLFRGEYKFLRKEGASRRVARWHVHRMIAMLSNGNGWQVEMPGDADMLTDEDYETARHVELTDTKVSPEFFDELLEGDDEYPW